LSFYIANIDSSLVFAVYLDGVNIQYMPSSNEKSNRLKGTETSSLRKNTLDNDSFSESLQNSDVQAVAGTAIDAVETSGRVSEALSESGGKRPSSMSSKGAGSSGTGNKRKLSNSKSLLAGAPSVSVMKRQVEREIRHEIDLLHRRAKKLMRSSSPTSFFELATVARKIRSLKKMLSSLVKSSVNKVKTLWLRYVHGIM